MKNIFVGILLMSFMGFTSAQDLAYHAEESLTTKVTSFEKNTDLLVHKKYLEEISSDNLPLSAIYLQKKLSQFELKDSEGFNNGLNETQIEFNSNDDEIVASFNQEGILISTKEKYYNVNLPANIEAHLLQDYNGWKMIDTRFFVKYKKDKAPLKYYIVRIENEDEFRYLQLDI